jgi:hypothetical protein
MILRANVTEDWLLGRITVSDYLDFLDSQEGIDVFELPGYWGIEDVIS